MNAFLKGLLAAALGGAATGVTSTAAGATGKQTTVAAVTGAVVAIVHLFLPSPKQSLQ